MKFRAMLTSAVFGLTAAIQPALGYVPTCGSNSALLMPDAAGNLTMAPAPAPGNGSEGLDFTSNATQHYTYDAWNRLTQVEYDPDGPSGTDPRVVIQTSVYDGRGRRIQHTASNSPGLNATYHDYYSGQQIIETRSGASGGATVVRQQVWGPQYIDELVHARANREPLDDPLMDPADPDHVVQDGIALHSPLFNVLMVLNAIPNDPDQGVPLYRHEYTLYGEMQTFVSSGPTDLTLTLAVSQMPRVTSAVGGVDQPYPLTVASHQGLPFDEATGLIENRARFRNPYTGTFISRDPIGYPDGMNGYAAHHIVYVRLDPTGMEQMTNRPGVNPEDIAFGAGEAALGLGHLAITRPYDLLGNAGLAIPESDLPQDFKNFRDASDEDCCECEAWLIGQHIGESRPGGDFEHIGRFGHLAIEARIKNDEGKCERWIIELREPTDYFGQDSLITEGHGRGIAASVEAKSPQRRFGMHIARIPEGLATKPLPPSRRRQPDNTPAQIMANKISCGGDPCESLKRLGNAAWNIGKRTSADGTEYSALTLNSNSFAWQTVTDAGCNAESPFFTPRFPGLHGRWPSPVSRPGPASRPPTPGRR